MKKTVAFFVLMLILMLSVFISAQADSERSTAIIVGGNADRVHLRAKPSQDSESLGLYFGGTPVSYTGNLNDKWVSVQIGHEQGYMMSAFLSDRLTETYPLNEMKTGTVHTNSWVNLRAAASTNSQGLMRLQEGDQVIIMGETSSHWYYVSCDGLAGYVKSAYVEYRATSFKLALIE